MPLASELASELVHARQQMALSLGWHIVIACLGMGFPLLVLLAEWRHLRTGDPLWRTIAVRWSKALGVLFAVGAVSGTILSFEFGILWPRWMERFGDVMGLAFTMEGFAFFLEAIFVGIYLYGWDRLPPKVHFLAGVPIPIAGCLSAFFVVSANGWMNDPSGFHLAANGFPDRVDPWAAVFNSALWPESTHMILAAFIVTGFLIACVHGFALWRRRPEGALREYQRKAFTLAFAMGAVAVPAQIVVGDWAARHVAEHQPVKLAAMEGLNETRAGAPLAIGGLYVDGKLRGAVEIPKMLSFISFHDTDATVVGLESVPPGDRPNTLVVHASFDVMVGIGFSMLGLAAWFLVARRRRRGLPRSRWFLPLAVAAGPASVLALETGWVVTEVGRQPWIVYKVMRTTDAVTTAGGIRYGYYGLIVVYAALTFATVTVLRRLARAPLPSEPDIAPEGP